MALDSYSALQASVGTWLGRTDLASLAPDLIALCESEVNRTLRHRKMIKRSDAALNEQLENLPGDFLEAVNFRLLGLPNPIEYKSPIEFARLPELQDPANVPKYYTLIGTQIAFAPAPTGQTLEMVYYAKLPALSGDVTVNWLLTDAPDVYLYGALWKASLSVLREDDRAGLWRDAYAEAFAALDAADTAAIYSGAPLVMKVG